MFGANKRIELESSSAFRPFNDLRSLMRIEDVCTEPLTEADRIDVGSVQRTNKGATLVAWLNKIQRRMIDCGTDSVAYILKPRAPCLTLPPLNDPDLESKTEEVCIFTD